MKKPSVSSQLISTVDLITRSAVFNMPNGIKAYAIADETMETAKSLVETAKHLRDMARRKTSTLPNRASLNPVPAPSDFLVQTRSETMEAYADVHHDQNEDTMRRRNLSFKSAHPVTMLEARQIFAQAVPESYNAFTPACIGKLPQDRMAYLARECSPCIYVLGPAFPQSASMKADEFNFYPEGYVKKYGDNQFTIPGPVTRVWWD